MSFSGTYSPESLAIVLNNYLIKPKDFASDSIVSIAQNSKNYRQVPGIRGKSTTVHTRDRSGVITLRLMQTSQTNEIMTKIAQDDNINMTGLLTVTIKDNSGQSVYQFLNCRLEGQPDVDYFGGQTSARTWRIFYDRQVDYYVGGNRVPPLDILSGIF